MITLFKVGEVVVAQLVEQWLPASEIRGSNPFIDKFYLNKSLVYTVTKFFLLHIPGQHFTPNKRT